MSSENKLQVIKQQLDVVKPSFEELNLTGLNFTKEVEFAMQILEKNKYMQGATQQSFVNAIKNIALTGLSLNPVLKFCYLIPRNDRKTGLQCVAEPSYVGLIKILTDTGSVIGISATIVYEKEIDSLEISEGVDGYAKHKPYFGKDKPGDPIACYTKAKLPDGTIHVSLLRSWQWEDIMLRSESVKSYHEKQKKGEWAALPVWLTDKEEMIRKTAIKNHYKYLPKTEKALRVAEAIDVDNQANGIDFEEEKRRQEQEHNKNKAETLSLDILDPNNKEDQDRFNKITSLFKHPILPESFTVSGNVFNVSERMISVQEEYDSGKLQKEKANKIETVMLKYISEFENLKSKENEQ